jgi:hypothetical protein
MSTLNSRVLQQTCRYLQDVHVLQGNSFILCQHVSVFCRLGYRPLYKFMRMNML